MYAVAEPAVKLGALVGEGRTSDVYGWGADSVVKVPRAWVPDDWAAIEAQLSSEVVRCGVSAPEVRDLTSVDGRQAVVFERIEGPTLWSEMVDRPSEIPALGRAMADLQREIHSTGPSGSLPDVVERTCSKIDDATELSDGDRRDAKSIVRSLPRGAALLHGDLHPGNVIVSPRGLVTIDWFDAAVGHPLADVVRTSIMCRPTEAETPVNHLPGASAGAMSQIHELHLEAFGALLAHSGSQLRDWESVMAVSRLAERTDVDDARLLRLWNDRHHVDWSSPLGELAPVDISTSG